MSSLRSTADVDANGAAGVRNARGLFKSRAYDEIRRMILSSELAPGEFIAERPLAAKLGMSTTPVRSALQRLEVEGLLSISPQQGAVVRDFSFHEIAELYEIRMALEPFVARRIAGRLNSSQVERVRANLEAQRENFVRRDIGDCVRLDEDFHTLFSEFLDNREICRVMAKLRDRTHRIFHRVFSLNPGRIEGSFQEHLAIAETIIQGPAELAAQRVEAHLDFGRRALVDPLFM
ncbi:GntR family transcriptional regulator [Paludisphaera rhizosphaerae]|uniref:GntR family transcriptional regulator n=1 Tax=Paludisphaera rhizosphaerae TaxID=2711216 RepID=UPI0013EB350E|nr:GntR family transcriptional regulator [Paludisphaera rhizosphaerae]